MFFADFEEENAGPGSSPQAVLRFDSARANHNTLASGAMTLSECACVCVCLRANGIHPSISCVPVDAAVLWTASAQHHLFSHMQNMHMLAAGVSAPLSGQRDRGGGCVWAEPGRAGPSRAGNLAGGTREQCRTAALLLGSSVSSQLSCVPLMTARVAGAGGSLELEHV